MQFDNATITYIDGKVVGLNEDENEKEPDTLGQNPNPKAGKLKTTRTVRFAPNYDLTIDDCEKCKVAQLKNGDKVMVVDGTEGPDGNFTAANRMVVVRDEEKAKAHAEAGAKRVRQRHGKVVTDEPEKKKKGKGVAAVATGDAVDESKTHHTKK